MNVPGWLLWGFVATLLLTTIMAGSQGAGLTRVSLPYLLGTMLVEGRDRARRVGFAMHLALGMAFSLVYVAVFQSLGAAGAWRGLGLGLAHAAFLLVGVMPMLPSLHPRMANEQQGPTVSRQLEPPGMLALHYGPRTPLTVIVAHALFGLVLGTFYRVG